MASILKPFLICQSLQSPETWLCVSHAASSSSKRDGTFGLLYTAATILIKITFFEHVMVHGKSVQDRL